MSQVFMVEPCPLGVVDRGDTVLVGARASVVARVVDSEIERRDAGGPATAHTLVELRDRAGGRICRDVPDVVVHRVLPTPGPSPVEEAAVQVVDAWQAGPAVEGEQDSPLTRALSALSRAVIASRPVSVEEA